MTCKTVTYQSSTTSERISITPHQERIMRDAGRWFCDRRGAEMVDVHRGLSVGEPTYSDDEVRRLADA